VTLSHSWPCGGWQSCYKSDVREKKMVVTDRAAKLSSVRLRRRGSHANCRVAAARSDQFLRLPPGATVVDVGCVAVAVAELAEARRVIVSGGGIALVGQD
jgi:hypothetical protein